MLAKITIALALILGSASGALAATKQKHNANRGYDWQAYDLYYYDTRGQHSGSVTRVKSAHAKTAPVKTVRIEATQIEAKQVEATQLEVRQVEATQVETTQVEATQVEATQVETSRVVTSQVETSQVEASQVEASQVAARQAEAAPVEACEAEAAQAKTKQVKAKHAKTARVKKAHVKTAHVKKQKQRTSQSTLAVLKPKRSRGLYDPLDNARAQYAGPASRAEATPRPRHGNNPAHDVYDTRGWYIGSDPDATVRAMMAMDPTGSD